MYNNEIRDSAKKNNVKLWQLADAMNVSEATMTRLLRRELPDAENRRILAIIRNLSKTA